MVAVITTGKSIYGALAYNERKVERGDAVLLGAVNSLARAQRQTLAEKHRSLQSVADRNQRTKRNSVHIALSFAKGDQLDAAQLRQIAKEYLIGIDFDRQPAYVYRHQDTDHDHIHIVTTNITREGKRIDDSFVGATKSEVVRKAIEQRYGLVIAEEQGKKQSAAQRLVGAAAPPPPGGDDLGELRSYARHTVWNTLRAYKPASLGELNALLRERNLKVRLEKGSRPDGTEWRGYSAVRTDQRSGQENSAAIKASKIFAVGWGSTLESTMERNGKQSAKSLTRLKTAINKAFADERTPAEEVVERLRADRIRVIHHHTAEGRRYGVHYVDEVSGHLFKASKVGRSFSAAEWNRREEKNTLATEDYRQLVAGMNGYLRDQDRKVGFRSTVLRELTSDRLISSIATTHTEEVIRPYVEEYVAAARKDYAEAAKRDQRQLKELYWALAQVKSEYRRGLTVSLGLELDGSTISVRGNPEVQLSSDRLRIDQLSKGFRPGSLSAEERRMLIGVGRYRGIGGLPLNVNTTTVDWPYWKDKFKPKVARQLGQQLHDNLIKEVLMKGMTKGTAAAAAADDDDAVAKKEEVDKAKQSLVVQLAARGILVEPLEQGGYRARSFNVGEEVRALQLSGKYAEKLDGLSYRREDYQRIRALVEDESARRAIELLQQAKKGKLRSAQGREVPRRLSRELRSYLTSSGDRVQGSGLYRILRVMDEDEKLTHEERRQNQVLRR